MAKTVNLGDIATVKAGVKIYEKGKGDPPQTKEILEKRPYTKVGNRPDGWLNLYRGKHIDRYKLLAPDEFIKYGNWLAAPRNPNLFKNPKILMRRTDDCIKACIENESSIAVNSCHVILLKEELNKTSNHLYLLGIINSKLIQHIFELQNPQMVDKIFAEIKVVYVEKLPITSFDFSSFSKRTLYDNMVNLVERMLDLHKQLSSAKLPQDKTVLQRRIKATDQNIDRLVYELYGLTDKEIEIVEKA